MLTLARDADEFLLTLDADNLIVACSVLRTRCTEPTRFDCHNALGLSFVAQLPDLHQAAIGRLLAEVRDSGRPCTQDIRFDGLEERFSCSVSVLAQAAGAPMHLACLLRNHGAIAQPAIDRFEQALSLARVAWFERDLKTDIGIGSPSLAQIYGLEHPRGPWHFNEVRSRIVPEDAARHSDEIAAGLAPRIDDMEARVINYRIRRPDGTLRHLEVRYRNLYSLERPRTYGLIFDVTEAKQIEERLLESTSWLNIALSSAGILLWVHDYATGQVRTSSNFDEFTGLKTGRTHWHHDALLSTIDEPGRAIFADALTHWSSGHGEHRPRFTITRADGTQRWVEASSTLERGAQGQPLRLLGVSWDITSEVEQELARKASDERLQRIADLVPGMVYQFKRDAEGHYSFPYASDGIRDIYGFTAEELRLSAAALADRIHPDDFHAVLRSMRISAETQTHWQHQYRVNHPTRGLRWVMGTANPQQAPDGSTLWYGHIVDVTDRHDDQVLLHESEARLRLALSAAAMSSWEWDLRTDQMQTSHTLSTLLGLPASTNPSRLIFDATHPEDVDALRARFAAVVRDRERALFTIEYRFRWADGSYRWVELRARAVIDEHTGQVTSIYGVTADINQRRQAEAERDRLQQQLSQAQKMEALGLLTGGVAHDFNNILASVLGYSSLALQRYGAASPPKLADYLGEVIKAGERARDLVAQMLAFSRGETSEVTRLEPAPLVEQMMKMLRPILPSSIGITLDIAPDLPAVAANVVQLQQVLLNLCINARDATIGVGTITIAARYEHFERADCASCHKQFSGSYIALSVADDGQGITPAQRIRIFEPFYTTKVEQKGTGMGLATVHGIVHRHGGHIGLVSRPAVGSTFTIALPAADTAQPGPQGTATEGDPDTLPRATWPARILVVDDEPSIAHCTAEILAYAGFEATIETDSERAAERFEDAPDFFDLIITDQTMPHLTGHQLSVIMLNRRPHLPVLLMTGHSAAVDEEQALALGIRRYLRKPVPRAELLQAVLSELPAAPAAATQAS